MNDDGLEDCTAAEPAEAGISSVPEDEDIDEDRLFCSGLQEKIPRLTYDVYSLRPSDPEIYKKTAAVLHDMAGIFIPEFFLRILQVWHEDVDEDPDQSRRLFFEIDNKILKSLQAMHRAQICDRVKGFDLKLAKVMSVIFQHYQTAARDLPKDALENLVPNWPDKIHSVPNAKLTNADGSWKIVSEKVQKLPVAIASKGQDVDRLKPLLRTTVGPSNYSPSSTMSRSRVHSFGRHDSKLSTSNQENRKSGAVEYGLTFDIFAPEPKIFSLYMNSEMGYTADPKESPVDPHPNCDKKDPSGSSRRIWRHLKRVSARVKRSLRGNPLNFPPAEDAADK